MISTNQAAKRLGLNSATLSRYIKAKKIPPPETVMAGGLKVHSWTEEHIEKARKLLPKIKNGRKTRWQKQREKQKKQTQTKRK